MKSAVWCSEPDVVRDVISANSSAVDGVISLALCLFAFRLFSPAVDIAATSLRPPAKRNKCVTFTLWGVAGDRNEQACGAMARRFRLTGTLAHCQEEVPAC